MHLPGPSETSPEMTVPLGARPLVGLLQRSLGGAAIVGLAIATVLLWVLARPSGQPTGRYVGEMLGTTAILLFTCSLVLATKAPFLCEIPGLAVSIECIYGIDGAP